MGEKLFYILLYEKSEGKPEKSGKSPEIDSKKR